MKIILQTHDGGFVRDAEIPPFHRKMQADITRARDYLSAYAARYAPDVPSNFIDALLSALGEISPEEAESGLKSVQLEIESAY